ncbi:adenine phosphoribosyltransferase [Nitrospina gracilis]|uniref:adenine phosphoribosyltransferase n=1 Tax=Nitrospina gracilis TaxID=35801 RepID=UPI001EFFFB95|nr:adenine phosphoribosyltransferase [Nitrospina gracilis]MCF8721887.1 adenine phosphoribosyltransferase [Nitrospina gracilis Nb-211]
MKEIKEYIRDILNFPKEGIVFKDISPLLNHSDTFTRVIEMWKERYANRGIDTVVGVEARGFVFASAVAYAIGAGCVMIRKPGKLPYKTFTKTYDLEYGTDTIEVHQDAIDPGNKVLVIDDVLATGGTMEAVLELLMDNFNCELVEVTFLMELSFLGGRDKMKNLPVHSLVVY